MGLQVLVVESGEVLSRSMARVLRGAEPQIVRLADPRRAAALLAMLRMDLVMAEEELEPITGLQVLELSRRLQPEARRFLLCTTARPRDELDPGVATLCRGWLDDLVVQSLASLRTSWPLDL